MTHDIKNKHALSASFSKWFTEELEVALQEVDTNADKRIDLQELEAYFQKKNPKASPLSLGVWRNSFGSKIDASDDVHFRELGDCYGRQDIKKAAEAYRIALELDPKDMVTVRHLIEVFHRAEKADEISMHLKQIFGYSHKLEDDIALAKLLNQVGAPEIKDGWVFVAEQRMHSGLTSRAEEIYIEAIKQNPKKEIYRTLYTRAGEGRRRLPVKFDSESDPRTYWLYNALRDQYVTELQMDRNEDGAIDVGEVFAAVEEHVNSDDHVKELAAVGMTVPGLDFKKLQTSQGFPQLNSNFAYFQARRLEKSGNKKNAIEWYKLALSLDRKNALAARDLGHLLTEDPKTQEVGLQLMGGSFELGLQDEASRKKLGEGLARVGLREIGSSDSFSLGMEKMRGAYELGYREGKFLERLAKLLFKAGETELALVIGLKRLEQPEVSEEFQATVSQWAIGEKVDAQKIVDPEFWGEKAQEAFKNSQNLRAVTLLSHAENLYAHDIAKKDSAANIGGVFQIKVNENIPGWQKMWQRGSWELNYFKFTLLGSQKDPKTGKMADAAHWQGPLFDHFYARKKEIQDLLGTMPPGPQLEGAKTELTRLEEAEVLLKQLEGLKFKRFNFDAFVYETRWNIAAGALTGDTERIKRGREYFIQIKQYEAAEQRFFKIYNVSDDQFSKVGFTQFRHILDISADNHTVVGGYLIPPEVMKDGQISYVELQVRDFLPNEGKNGWVPKGLISSLEVPFEALRSSAFEREYQKLKAENPVAAEKVRLTFLQFFKYEQRHRDASFSINTNNFNALQQESELLNEWFDPERNPELYTFLERVGELEVEDQKKELKKNKGARERQALGEGINALETYPVLFQSLDEGQGEIANILGLPRDNPQYQNLSKHFENIGLLVLNRAESYRTYLQSEIHRYAQEDKKEEYDDCVDMKMRCGKSKVTDWNSPRIKAAQAKIKTLEEKMVQLENLKIDGPEDLPVFRGLLADFSVFEEDFVQAYLKREIDFVAKLPKTKGSVQFYAQLNAINFGNMPKLEDRVQAYLKLNEHLDRAVLRGDLENRVAMYKSQSETASTTDNIVNGVSWVLGQSYRVDDESAHTRMSDNYAELIKNFDAAQAKLMEAEKLKEEIGLVEILRLEEEGRGQLAEAEKIEAEIKNFTEAENRLKEIQAQLISGEIHEAEAKAEESEVKSQVADPRYLTDPKHFQRRSNRAKEFRVQGEAKLKTAQELRQAAGEEKIANFEKLEAEGQSDLQLVHLKYAGYDKSIFAKNLALNHEGNLQFEMASEALGMVLAATIAPAVAGRLAPAFIRSLVALTRVTGIPTTLAIRATPAALKISAFTNVARGWSALVSWDGDRFYDRKKGILSNMLHWTEENAVNWVIWFKFVPGASHLFFRLMDWGMTRLARHQLVKKGIVVTEQLLAERVASLYKSWAGWSAAKLGGLGAETVGFGLGNATTQTYYGTKQGIINLAKGKDFGFNPFDAIGDTLGNPGAWWHDLQFIFWMRAFGTVVHPTMQPLLQSTNAWSMKKYEGILKDYNRQIRELQDTLGGYIQTGKGDPLKINRQLIQALKTQRLLMAQVPELRNSEVYQHNVKMLDASIGQEALEGIFSQKNPYGIQMQWGEMRLSAHGSYSPRHAAGFVKQLRAIRETQSSAEVQVFPNGLIEIKMPHPILNESIVVRLSPKGRLSKGTLGAMQRVWSGKATTELATKNKASEKAAKGFAALAQGVDALLKGWASALNKIGFGGGPFVLMAVPPGGEKRGTHSEVSEKASPTKEIQATKEVGEKAAGTLTQGAAQMVGMDLASARQAYEARRDSPERAKLHQQIVQKLLATGTTSENPNLIFTAGAPGAGKSVAIQVLDGAGYVDTSKYLLIDPDQIKEMIPEYQILKDIDATQAASIVHAESARIQDLIFEEALKNKKNTIVDGTLRAKDFWDQEINRIKREYPYFSKGIGIILVRASQATSLDRVNTRAKVSGRHVPESFVIDTHKAVDASFEALREIVGIAFVVDNETRPIIKSFYKNGETVTVNLQVPLASDKNIMVDYQVEVPVEKLATDHSVGTVDQIKGNKRVIRIQTGPEYNREKLKSDFLRHLDPEEHWVVVKGEDPQARDVLEVAKELGFETIIMGTADNPPTHLNGLPTFYAVAPDKVELGKMWEGVIANDAENRAQHLALDFTRPHHRSLAKLAQDLHASRLQSQAELKAALEAKGIEYVASAELDAKVLQGRTPILFSGASKSSWPKISAKNQVEVTKSIEESLSTLDPSKVVIVTGGTNYGVEKIVHEVARAKGFTVLGTFVELASQASQEIGPVTHAVEMGNSWYGKSRPVLQFIKKHKGSVIFIGGGGILEVEIQMAKELGVDFHLMKGPEGAANHMVSVMPERAFSGADGLVSQVYQKYPGLMKSDPVILKEARDSMFRDYVRSLKGGPTQVVSYAKLRTLAQGKKVRVLGGYSGLGYENPEAVKAHLKAQMMRDGDNTLYVIGGTRDGIGEAYQWIPEIAKELGYQNFKTAGITSRNAAQFGIAAQDYIVFVDTPVNSWEVVENGRSLMVGIAQETGGEMIYFRGGEVSASEIGEALGKGVKVTIVADTQIAPNAKNAAKKLLKDPRFTTDGTQKFVSSAGSYPTLTVVRGLE